jgi:hypothetical protein
MISNDYLSKICHKYYCEKCDYGTSKKSSYDDHLISKKHNKSTIVNDNQALFCPKYACKNCNKIYKDNSGLWRHNKVCKIKDDNNENPKESIDKDEIIKLLLKQNSELIKEQSDIKQIILEICKNGSNNTTHTNSHNKTFNLQFFLNETCKDAMNITDFVDSIKLQLTDLEKVCDIGYTQGISDIITTNLKALDVTKRPLHCTDKKRETVYIKDENTWEKEDENKSKLRKVIKKVANKNSKLLSQFREKNPNYKNSDSQVSDKYDRMVIEAMGGVGDNDSEKENKIIHNISNCVTIDKIVE